MKKPAAWACGLFLITLVLYWPGRDFAYIWDDQAYVEHNEHVQNGLNWDSFRYAFQVSVSNWHPLVWLSWMLDVELQGFSPRAFRTTNYLLHSANAVLLFLWLRKLTGRDSASLFVAAVFAFHPLHVESVQWISERKDVLSMFFGLLTLLAWQRYLQVRRYRQLAWVCLAYLASLMSKQMFVTLPVLLLLLDYWPLQRLSGGSFKSQIGRRGVHHNHNENIDGVRPHSGQTVGFLRFKGYSRRVIRSYVEWFRHKSLSLVESQRNSTGCGECGFGESLSWRRLLSEKFLLFGIAAILCVVALVAQRIGGSVKSIEAFSLPVRIANAVHTLWLYLGKALCPKNLIIFYPHPGNAILTKRILLEFIGLMVLTVILICQTQRRYLIVGWLWYLVSLLPVIGLVQIGDQQMADRYAYLPMLGIYWACTWWLIDVTPARWERVFRIAVATSALTYFAWMTHEQIGNWRNNSVLNGHMKTVNRDRE